MLEGRKRLELRDFGAEGFWRGGEVETVGDGGEERGGRRKRGFCYEGEVRVAAIHLRTASR